MFWLFLAVVVNDTAPCLALTDIAYNIKYFNFQTSSNNERGKELGKGYHSAKDIVSTKLNIFQMNE